MGELLRRFRYPLTYLVLSALCLTTLAGRGSPTSLGLGSQLVLTLTLPLEQMVTLPVRQVRSLWREYVALVEVREENERLRERLERLSDENLQYREAIVSSERFQRLAGFRARREVPMVPANVVGQDLSRWFQSVVIDQGNTSGIRAGMPVITDSGVVGVVSGTTPSASKVLLVIDPQSRVDAFVQRSRARGSVRGGSDRECEFEYVLRDDDVRKGDQLLTSGLDSVYPKGLVVGYVTGVDRRPYGLFQRATVEPAVDFRRLEEVFVILESRDLPPDSEFSSDDPGLWAATPPGPDAPAPDGAPAAAGASPDAGTTPPAAPAP